jgi:hypothetical protein
MPESIAAREYYLSRLRSIDARLQGEVLGEGLFYELVAARVMLMQAVRSEADEAEYGLGLSE